MSNDPNRKLAGLLIAALLGALAVPSALAGQEADPSKPAEDRPADLDEIPAPRDPWVIVDVGIGDDRGISMVIEPFTCEGASDCLRVRIENQGPDDEVILLGAMLGGGRAQDPSRLELEVTDRTGETTTYRYANPARINVGGTLHPMVVPLLAQGRYEMILPLHHFMIPRVPYKRFVPPEGRFELNLRLEGSVPFQNKPYLGGLYLWAGDVRSNVLVYGTETDGSTDEDAGPGGP